MRIELTDFKLAGYYPYNPLKCHSMELNRELKGCTPWIDARVPGSVYDDLYRAGLIEDPYYDMNSLRCEWVSARWWVYVTRFDAPAGECVDLVIEGADSPMHVFLNGEPLGTHQNAFTPFVREVAGRLRPRDNFLKIVLESAPDEMGQVGYTDRTFTQKPRFGYKWDFGVRMIGMGLFRPVRLETRGAAKLTGQHFRWDGERALLDLETEGGEAVEAELSFAGEPVWRGRAETANAAWRVDVPEPRLWYPNGMGAQPLYDLCVRVYAGGRVAQELSRRVGLKTLRLERAEGAPSDARPYVFVVNGRRMFVKGVNLVPFDMQYGLVDRARYAGQLGQAREMNVNLVRVWGGGLIESEDFYDLCDELGLLVWQDFVQSSSGIDNYPSHRPEFLRLLAESAECATREKRSHVSTAVFCGGNELMRPDYIPVDESVPNIAMLAGICAKNCPELPFLPSTPSGPVFAPDFARAERNHDVHGQWTFLGEREHYRYFNELECLLHSEFGVDGLTNYSAIERSMPERRRYVCDYDEDMHWRHRGEWWNAYARDTGIFGPIETLAAQVELSQFLQAEGLRYAVDAHRRKAFRPAGCMVWQLNEPFPNGSCTNLIDFYGTPKTAYYALRGAFAANTASFRYESLIYAPGETAAFALYAVTEAERAEIVLRAAIDGRPALVKRYVGRGAGAQKLDELALPMGQRTLCLEAEVRAGGRTTFARCLLLARGGNGFCAQDAIPVFNRLLREDVSCFDGEECRVR